MDATSDDLLKPLGLDRPHRAFRWFDLSKARYLGLGLAASALGIGAAVAIMSGSAGGPVAQGARQTPSLAELRPPRAPDAPRVEPEPRPRAADGPAESPRRTAAEVETASGVSVVRPQGAAAPPSLVISIPDESIRLNPAPDPRLIEMTRLGALPKIGADGARPSAVYARPAGALPGGARPAARIAIMVGGLGLDSDATADAIAKLPAPVTLAFAPYGSDLDRVAARARAEGHEVMLQVPMEPFDYPVNDPGPHTLTAKAKPQENVERLHWAMSRFTGYTGLVNYMGARLTADEAALGPVMREIGARGLAFLDDGSSPRSLAARIGSFTGAATARADVTLDASLRSEAIDRELGRLEGMARERGLAIGTASALPLTVERISRWARTLENRGILLVPVSAAFRRGNP